MNVNIDIKYIDDIFASIFMNKQFVEIVNQTFYGYSAQMSMKYVAIVTINYTANTTNPYIGKCELKFADGQIVESNIHTNTFANAFSFILNIVQHEFILNKYSYKELKGIK